VVEEEQEEVDGAQRRALLQTKMLWTKNWILSCKSVKRIQVILRRVNLKLCTFSNDWNFKSMNTVIFFPK